MSGSEVFWGKGWKERIISITELEGKAASGGGGVEYERDALGKMKDTQRLEKRKLQDVNFSIEMKEYLGIFHI